MANPGFALATPQACRHWWLCQAPRDEMWRRSIKIRGYYFEGIRVTHAQCKYCDAECDFRELLSTDTQGMAIGVAGLVAKEMVG